MILVVGQCDERAKMHDGIPKEWLGSPVSAQHAEETITVNGVPFGASRRSGKFQGGNDRR